MIVRENGGVKTPAVSPDILRAQRLLDFFPPEEPEERFDEDEERDRDALAPGEDLPDECDRLGAILSVEPRDRGGETRGSADSVRY
ncbi:MAG: hypothetical protein ABIH26_04225, partial [Candidatus Eisenbacteria bacterium]